MAEINYINGYEIADAKAREDASEAKTKANRVDTLQTQLQAETLTRADMDATLQNQISGLANGAPLKASTLSDMTDTTRVYVLITDGYVYYYDGSQWVQGWKYQAEVSDTQVELLDITKCNKFTENTELIKFGYEQGTMNSETGEKGSTSNTRVRTVGRFHVLKNETLKVILPENTQLSVYRYSSKSNGFISTTGFQSVSEYYINNEDVWIMLLIKNSDNSEISSDDVASDTFVYRYSENDSELIWEKGSFSTMNNSYSSAYDLRSITRYFLPKNISAVKVKVPTDYNLFIITYENGVYKNYSNLAEFSHFRYDVYDYRLAIENKDGETPVDPEDVEELIIVTYNKDKLNFLEVPVTFERMGLSASGNVTDNNKTKSQSISEFYTTMRSNLFLNVTPGSPVVGTFDNTMDMYEYDENFNFVKTSTILSDVPSIVANNTHYVKFVMTFSEEEKTISKLIYNFKIVNDKIEFVKNKYYSNIRRYVYAVNYPKGRDVNANNVTTAAPQYNQEIGYTAGLLKLPKNYTQKGTPVRMIIFCHSSGDYLGFTDTSFSTNYADYINYLVDEGYAVYDTWGHSSFAPVTTTTPHDYGNPDNMACLTAGYKWCIENFNIADDGVFVASKSLGGQSAGNLCFSTNGIPVLAAGLLAPALSVLKRGVGYKPEERLENAWAFDMEGDYETILSTVGSGTVGANLPIEDAAYKNLIKQNADKFMAYTPMWNGLVNANINDLCEWSFNQGQGDVVLANWENLVRVCPTPIKIWVAVDDTTTPHSISYNFIKTLKNGGCLAEIRSLPENTGGHHAVDTDANALKVELINTRLGIEYSNVPLAYVELVNWFRRFEI